MKSNRMNIESIIEVLAWFSEAKLAKFRVYVFHVKPGVLKELLK